MEFTNGLKLFMIMYLFINLDKLHCSPLTDSNEKLSDESDLSNSKSETQLPPLLFPVDTNNLSENKTMLTILQNLTTLPEDSSAIDGTISSTTESVPEIIKNASEENDDDEKLTKDESENQSSTEDTSKSQTIENKSEEESSEKSNESIKTSENNSNEEINLNDSKKQKIIDNISEEETDEDENPKGDTEEVQNNNKSYDDDDLEERFNSDNKLENSDDFTDEEIVVDQASLHPGHITAIIISALCVLGICVYIGLACFRHRLEQRYGMRERLVTEDDYFNNNDTRHFEL